MRIIFALLTINLLNSILGTLYLNNKMKNIVKISFPLHLLLYDTIKNFFHPIHTLYLLYCIFFLKPKDEEKLDQAITDVIKKLDE